MVALAFIISVIALVLAIVAFRRTGGMTDLKEEVDSLGSVTNTLRDKTANTLEKMEKAVRKTDKDENLEDKGSETYGDEQER